MTNVADKVACVWTWDSWRRRNWSETRDVELLG